MSLPMFCVVLLASFILASIPAFAEEPLRIGVLNDMSGPYADYQGRGSLAAAQLGVEDFGGKVKRGARDRSDWG